MRNSMTIHVAGADAVLYKFYQPAGDGTASGSQKPNAN